MDLAAELADLPFAVATSPWDGHEVNIGYAVMNQPMSSGDLLGLRVFPRSDFGGYVSVWHRDPGGAWSQYVDRGPVAAGCPRVWGPALDHAGAATIEVDWAIGAAHDTIEDPEEYAALRRATVGPDA